MRRKILSFASACCALLHYGVASAQQPVTLQDAIQSALAQGPRIAVLHADSAAAAARLITARAYPNPTVSPAWTRSAPNWHLEIEQPLEYPFLRAARIRAATLGAGAASYLASAERAMIRYDVEVAYANAAAGAMTRDLANRNAAAAAEMLRITRAREQAGDASELDIRLAQVTAAQAQMDALSDSLNAIESVLALQALMGLNTSHVDVVPADSLAGWQIAAAPAGRQALRVAAATQQLESERANVALARAQRIPFPALRLGVEWHEPDVQGLEPIIGFALPLPLFDRNRGPVMEARAAQDRAQAELALVELETQNAIALAQQQQALAQQRARRGRDMVQDAERVAALALTAYREGEYTLANVIEAQRNVRDAVRSYVEALQASRIAQAAVVRAQVVGGSE